MYTTDLATVADRLRGARRLVVLTGAGVSAASGVPTFRGAGGLWRRHRPEDVATPHAFARDPQLVWEWYDWRRTLIAACRPNRAHALLANWSRRFADFSLMTQNVDGLHEAAGTDRLLRLHGSIWHLRCVRPCERGGAEWRDDRVPLQPLPPACPHCGALARPAVVWFGESLDPHGLAAAVDSASNADVFFAIGTSAIVYPAAGLLHEAKRSGAFTVEVNPDTTDATDLVDVALTGPAEKTLDALDALI